MTKVEKLEREIKELSGDEFAALRKWFFEYQEELWDCKFESEIFSGKFDALAGEALREHREGKSRPL